MEVVYDTFCGRKKTTVFEVLQSHQDEIDECPLVRCQGLNPSQSKSDDAQINAAYIYIHGRVSARIWVAHAQKLLPAVQPIKLLLNLVYVPLNMMAMRFLSMSQFLMVEDTNSESEGLCSLKVPRKSGSAHVWPHSACLVVARYSGVYIRSMFLLLFHY